MKFHKQMIDDDLGIHNVDGKHSIIHIQTMYKTTKIYILINQHQFVTINQTPHTGILHHL